MKKIICFLLLVAILVSSSACFFRSSRSKKEKAKNTEETTDVKKEDDDDSPESIDKPDGTILFEKDFGTFCILEGWEESENHSTSEKFFYIPEGNDDKSYTDNVSVRVGTNKYSEDEALDFKDAIMRQLSMQFSEDSYDSMTGEGTYTANDYMLLKFDFSGVDGGTEIIFYYIIADYKYCEVYLTCKDDPEEAKEAAQMIVDSFVWADED